jgi:hypothetical protein
MNPDMYAIPPDIRTGDALFGWFLKARVLKHIRRAPSTDAELDRDGPLWICFTADEYSKVPDLKSTVHAERASRLHPAASHLSQQQIDEMEFTADHIPDPAIISSSSTLIFKCIVFLLNNLASFFANHKYVYAYASCPSPKRPMLGAQARVPWVYGQNVRLSAGGPPPPPDFAQGEGEIRAWLFTKFVSDNSATPILHLIVSIDNDNLPIALTISPHYTHNVYVQLKSVYPSTATSSSARKITVYTKRFLDCGVLTTKYHETRFSTAFCMILAGSDYCPGLEGIGETTISKAIVDPGAQSLRLAAFNTATGLPEMPKVELFIDWIVRQRFKARLVTIPNRTRSIQLALWNLQYWATCLEHPPPPSPVDLPGLVAAPAGTKRPAQPQAQESPSAKAARTQSRFQVEG